MTAHWKILSFLLLAPALAHADDLSASPQSRATPEDLPSPRHPDFGVLFRDIAPVGDANANEAPPTPAPVETQTPDPSGPPERSNRSAMQDTNSAPTAHLLERGLAAWYQHPGKTASGEPNNPEAFTAAHRTLPLGTRLRVVSDKTGRAVVVRINDRISNKALRRHFLAIELSRKSAEAIGLEGVGTVSLYKAE